jgi:hypothetical protein
MKCFYEQNHAGAIDLIVGHAEAVQTVRALAKSGARYILTTTRFGSAEHVVDASERGGPDLYIVGGTGRYEIPFKEYDDVAILAAILAAN